MDSLNPTSSSSRETKGYRKKLERKLRDGKINSQKLLRDCHELGWDVRGSVRFGVKKDEGAGTCLRQLQSEHSSSSHAPLLCSSQSLLQPLFTGFDITTEDIRDTIRSVILPDTTQPPGSVDIRNRAALNKVVHLHFFNCDENTESLFARLAEAVGSRLYNPTCILSSTS